MNFSQTLSKYNKKRIFDGNVKSNKKPLKKEYDYFIIIPSYAEKLYINNTLLTINYQDKSLLKQSLIVIVINNSTDDDQSIIKNNQDTYKIIYKDKFNFEFIIIDCFSKNYVLDPKIAGVGTARKIGMDYCIGYAKQSSLFCCVDADTLLSKDYLSIVSKEYQEYHYNAAVVGFKHQRSEDKKIQKAIIKYESLLKSIAKNIKATGSPYGFVSMGSTMVCTMEAYILIGGMPQKKATEDFYFLQQLAKYDSIHVIDKILVHPSPRPEQRVYLGTGFRMKNIKNDILFSDLYINKEAYDALKIFYTIIEKKWDFKSTEIMSSIVKNNIKLKGYLKSNNFAKTLDQIQKNSINKKQLLDQFHRWFDNLKIYKFLKLYGD